MKANRIEDLRKHECAKIQSTKITLAVLRDMKERLDRFLDSDIRLKGSSGLLIAITLLLVAILIVMLFGFGFVELNAGKLGW